MSGFSVLRVDHVMVGVDFHDAIIPPKPDPIPLLPHVVGATLEWFSSAGVKKVPTVKADFNVVLQRGTDIGMGIPHVAINALLTFIMLGSGSKTYFGASTVKVGGTAAAVAVLGSMGINLNCGGTMGPPTPTGMVTAPSTVLAGMTVGDLYAGAVQATLDSMIQWGIGYALGEFTGAFGKSMKGIIYNNVVGLLAGWLVGTPLGYSFSFSVTSLTKFWDYSDRAHDRFRDYIDDPRHPVFL